MKITITTDADGPQLTLGLSPKEFEDYKAVLKQVRTTNLTADQVVLMDQLARNLNRMKFQNIMKHNDILEGSTYHFVATTDPTRKHLKGKPFTVAKVSAVHRRAGKGGRKRYRAYDGGGAWAEPEELESLPEFNCAQCVVGEYQQTGGGGPNGIVHYTCDACGHQVSFP